MRLHGTAVVLQRAEVRILPEDVAGRRPGDGCPRRAFDQVVALRSKRAVIVGRDAGAVLYVVGNDRIADGRGARSDTAPSLAARLPTIVQKYG
jgi:hypothetical protein